MNLGRTPTGVPRVDEGGVAGFCRELIAIPSLPREEGPLAAAIRARMLDLGYDEAFIDDMGNVVGRVGSGDGPRLLFDGHLDTVGVTDAAQWRHDPFGGDTEGGRIYGRGASDMKGSLAAMVYAAAAFAGGGGVGQSGRRHGLSGTIYVSGTVCEELVEGPGLGHVIEKVRPDYVVIGESTSLGLYIGQRGRAEIVLEALGVPAHSSTPHLGRNAVRLMAGFLRALDTLALPEDELLGRAIIEPTDVISRPYPGISVVPDLCRATLDRRLLVGETPETVVGQVLEACGMFGEGAGMAGSRGGGSAAGLSVRAFISEASFKTYTGFAVSVPKFAPAWKTAPGHPLVEAALRGLVGAGLPARLGAYGFCTNGSYSAGKYGLPTIGFGPANEAQAHTIDEFIEIEALLAGARGYAAIAAQVCAPAAGPVGDFKTK